MTTEPKRESVRVERVAELLGAGWEAHSYTGGGCDGTLSGPGGEVLEVDFRGFRDGAPIAHLLNRMPTAVGYSLDDEGLCSAEDIAGRIASDYPVIAGCHRADVAQLEELLRPASEFAAEVAGHLGEGWSGRGVDEGNRDEASPHCVLTCGDLRISWAWELKVSGRWPEPARWERPGWWHIHGDYEVQTRGNYLRDSPRINVGSNRPAKQVAGEIRRRLLPGYTAALERVQALDADHAEAVALVNTIAEQVQEALGYSDRQAPLALSQAEERALVRVHLPGGVYGDVECSAYSGGSVTLKLRSLCPAVAVRLLEVLREEYREDEPVSRPGSRAGGGEL